MDPGLWFLFALTFSSALAVPGANVAYAVAQTLDHGPWKGILASSGFAVASGLNIAIVLAGLGFIVKSHVNLLYYLKWVGVAYLVFLAIRSFAGSSNNSQASQDDGGARIFLFAILVSLTNPKVLLGNILVLPLFLNAEKPFVLQAIVMIATGCMLSFLIYSFYAVVVSQILNRLEKKNAGRVVGVIYLFAASMLASIIR
jgi:threonine/homoserine/homoserine lactone efflux protein